MIELKKTSVSFQKNKILDGVDLSVSESETLVLLGKNGSGKSVLLKLIAGLNPNFSGEIFINKLSLEKFYFNRDNSSNRLNKSEDDISLSYVFQKGGLFDSMTAYENVAFGLERMNLDKDLIEKRVNSSLERVGLKESSLKLPSELSGGMQKRVGLARAICINPSIILYDDPTAGLDPVLSDSIADLLLEIQKSYKTTSIVVTHDLKVTEKVADKIALLYDGNIVFYGSKDNFFSMQNEYAVQFIEGRESGPMTLL